MSLYFYLSHASADDTDHVQRFFADLSDIIRIHLRLPTNERVGFFDRRGHAPRAEWHGQLAEALRSGLVMLPLLSPTYLRSEYAGKEWQIFELRRRLFPTGRESDGIPRVIVPVIWIPSEGALPKMVSDGMVPVGDPNGSYNKIGLLTMLKSLHQYNREYSKFVNDLARHIIQTAERALLPQLDTLPSFEEIPSAFDRMRSDKPMNLDKLKVFVVDDEQQIRETLVECCRFYGFDAEGYENAEALMHEVYADPLHPKMPDLFLVDLELKRGMMQGMDLIECLNERDVPAAIIAISGNVPSDTLVQAYMIGAVAAESKPFTFQLLEKIERFAKIGMKRRLYQQDASPLDWFDPSRQDRPVFLSYASEHKKLATGLRNNMEAMDIGVWYAPSTLQPGDVWRHRLEEGIDHARVFIPLITDEYPSSPFCLGELTRFQKRLRQELLNPPILLPVLYNCKDETRKHELIRPILETHQYVDISRHFIDGLSALLLRVQKLAVQQKITSGM
jgi:FixJ family two-component response regulator